MQTLRSIIFTLLLFVSVLPWAIVCLCARVFGRAASYAVALNWVHMILWLCRVLCGLNWSISGQDNIPAQNCVVFLKHSSAYETIAQFMLLPRQSWVLKRELIWAPFFGWALATLQPIAINRSAGRSAVDQVIRQGKERLADGHWIMIFPEGTRMKAGETRRYGISGTLLAQAAGVNILPVAHNAGDFWPRRGWRKKPGTVQFVIGPPVDPADRDPREVNEELQGWIEGQVAELRSTQPEN